MGLGLGGLQSGGSVGQVLAALVGQDLVAKSLSLSQTTGNNAITLVQGARLKLSASGTRDYFFSTGNDASFQGQLTVVNGLIGQAGANSDQLLLTDTTNAQSFHFTINNTTLTLYNNAVAQLAQWNGSTKQFVVNADISYASFSDGSGTPGNATNNSVRGKNAIASGASTCAVGNSFVSATSTVVCVLEANDATATSIKSVVPGASTFTITTNANATANLKFSFIVFN